MLKNRKNVIKFKNIFAVVFMALIIMIIGLPQISMAAIELTDGQTVLPQYKPIWTKVSSTLDTTNKTITVRVKATAKDIQTINENVLINYESEVNSALSADDITVYINDTVVTDITKTVELKNRKYNSRRIGI